MTPRTIIPLLFLSLLLHHGRTQEFSTPKDDDISNHTTLLSKRKPFTRALVPKKELLLPLQDHIDFISKAVVSSAKAARENTTTPITTTCNYRQGDRWNADVSDYFNQRSWGDVDSACVTDVYGAGLSEDVGIVNSNEPGSTSRDVYDAVLAHARGISDIAGTAAGNAELTWRETATRGNAFEYSVRTQKCVHDYAGFVRRGTEWFIAERATNEDRDRNVGDDARLYMQEYVRLEGNRFRIAEVEALVASTEEMPFEFERGSTVLTKTSGAVTGSEFGTIFAMDNLAVEEALRAGEHNTQQASDATTPSNIAILAFPLAMNVIPVALIADVNTAGMLVYTLLTDVLTTIPLLIKGVEVLSIGAGTNIAVVTRVTGANLEGEGNKAGEVWVAECRANGDLTGIGVALIVVAVGFMVGGIVAEVVAMKWVKRRGRHNAGKASAGLVMAGVVGRGKAGSDDKNV